MAIPYLVRNVISQAILSKYRAFKRSRQHAKDAERTREAVFTDIYLSHKWGGTGSEFNSGSGTSDQQVAGAYVAMVAQQAVQEGFCGLRFVDLGCGDFRIGSQLLSFCSDYIGVDIVEPLIDSHRERFANDATHFMHLDIVADELPDGDVLFLRQVLQHLSNHEISVILQKLSKFRWVLVTEHYPVDNINVEPNRDKVHGGDIRLYENSGVYLTKPPFALPEDRVTLLLEVPAPEAGRNNQPGVLRTFLYRPEYSDNVKLARNS